ncbi:hypothetical protein [Streptomyces sp. NPDC017638]|uniref:hypothetical protein n=1 Tax=Streptomyces sp. NPDC017638 TaxID=3365004 RepID=UPI0037B3C8D0
MSRGAPVVRELASVLANQAAQDEFNTLRDDQAARLPELQHALSAQFAAGQAAEISSAIGLDFNARFERPVSDQNRSRVEEYSALMVFGEVPSTEVNRIGLMATRIATHATVGADPVSEDPVVRALVQRDGSWLLAEEFTLDDSGDLVPADGLWDAFKNCLASKCGGTCLGALATCLPLGALPAVVGCLAATCGLCAGRCAACVACDCGWLCSVVTGCCHR